MPGTASTRNTDRDYHKSRPYSVAKTPSPHTPVLFRLPLVEINRGTTESASGIGGEALSIASIEIAAPSSVAPPAPPVATAASIPQPMVVNSVSPTEESVGATAGDPGRSWWEHWSSGIVLILLIIALVAASIIALNDSGTTRVEQLAEGDSQIEGDFDLTNLRIPDITAPNPAVSIASKAAQPRKAEAEAPRAASTTQETALEKSAASNSSQTAATVNAPVNSPSPAVESSETGTAGSLILGELELSSFGEATPTEPASAKPDAAADKKTNVAQAETPQAAPSKAATAASKAEAYQLPTPAVATTAPSQAQSQPLATLSLPVGVQAPALFAEPDPPRTSENSLNVPALTTVGPTAAPPRSAGESPSFYDGAAASIQQTASSHQAALAAGNGLPGPGSQGPRQDMGTPALSATLTGVNAAPAFSTASHLPSAVQTSAGGSGAMPTMAPTPTLQAEPNSPARTNSPVAVVSSATPEMNAEAIVQAYLRFKALNKAQNMPSNRYPSSVEQNAAMSGAPTVSGSAQAPASQGNNLYPGN